MTFKVKRKVNYGNLTVCIVVLVTSFFVTLFTLAPEGRQETETNEITPVRVSYVQLPFPATNLTPVMASALYGKVDAVRKLYAFFAQTIAISTTTDSEKRPIMISLSDLYRRVLFPSNTASLRVLHLCHAAACVGPVLSANFRKQTRTSVQSVSIATMLFGDAKLSELVSSFLEQQNTTSYSINVNETYAAYRSTPLFGTLKKSGDKTEPIVRFQCIADRCRCYQKSITDRRRVWIKEQGNHEERLSEVHALDLWEKRAVDLWPPCSIVPFKMVEKLTGKPFGVDSFDLIDMDTGAEYQVAMLAFLNSLSETPTKDTAILLRLYNSPYLEDTVDAIDTLAASAHFYVLTLSGMCTALPEEESFRRKMDAVKKHFPFVVGERERQYQRIAEREPLCTVVMTKKFSDLKRLWDAYVRADKADEWHGRDETQQTVMRFFNWKNGAAFPNMTSDFEYEETEVKDVSVFLGRWLYRALYRYRFFFLASIPVIIVAFLLWNLSKTFGR